MKKLEKLKGQKPIKFKINLRIKNYFEDLQRHKYLVFKYSKDGKESWKFIKTSKIISIEKIDNDSINIKTNVENHEYNTFLNETFVTEEFTLAKIMCDEKMKGKINDQT